MPIGKLEPFNISSKQWPAYIRRVKQFLALNEIKAELHVAMVITVVGEATYALMRDLCSPADPETKTFEELVQLVADHLEPQRNAMLIKDRLETDWFIDLPSNRISINSYEIPYTLPLQVNR